MLSSEPTRITAAITVQSPLTAPSINRILSQVPASGGSPMIDSEAMVKAANVNGIRAPSPSSWLTRVRPAAV